VFPGTEVQLVRSGGGAFEVFADGKKVFSKLEQGRFPAYREVPALIA
jgi:selT/selW/selH-like putative selenoprotein